jgi:hypothetical protein
MLCNDYTTPERTKVFSAVNERFNENHLENVHQLLVFE